MGEDSTGRSGTLVMQLEDNPAHRADTSLTAQDDDPATRVADRGPAQLEPSPTVQIDIPPPRPITGTLQIGAVTGGAGETPQYELLSGPGYVALPGRPGSGVDRTTAAPPGPSKLVPLAVGVVVALGVGGVGLWLALRGSPSSKLLHEASVPPTQTSNAELETAPAPALQSASSSAAPALPEADQRARAALERLKSGVKSCAENTIHNLPGTSPAVPESMAWFKHGPYASLKRDWASPFFSCTRFQIDEPMPFAIQWQADPQGTRGMGIVWVDGNSDGVAESAYAFTATFSGGTVTTTEVEAIDTSRAMVHLP